MATQVLGPLAEPFEWTERNLGWKAETVALALVAVTIAALVGGRILVAETSPAAYAERYVVARAAGDSSAVWGSMHVEPAQADVSLLSQPALATMLRLPANRSMARDVTAETVSYGQSSATVYVSYSDGQARRKTELRLVRTPVERQWLLYPRWRVAATPAVIQLPRVIAGNPLSIDGLPVPASAKTVAVFAGTHQVTVGASPLLESDSETVVATAGTVPVTLKAKLTPQAQGQAADVVRAAVAACAKATMLVPPNCPQSVIDNINGAATWQLFGDPAAGASFVLGDGGTVVIDGHYQMAVSYEGEYPDVHRHRAIAGTYEAALTWDGSAFSLKSLGQPTSAVAEMARPAVDDAGVLAVVGAAFDRCAAVTTLTPSDCPQSINAYGDVAAVSWRLDRDPVGAATVSFSGSQGIFRITGTYSMTATYDETYQYQPTFHRRMQSTGKYTADLFWDGQKPVFITFE